MAGRLAGIVLMFGVILPVAAGAPVRVTADFSAGEDYPLVKTKFAVFNSGIVPLERYRRDIHLFDEVRPDSLRVDLAWGAPWAGRPHQTVSGDAANLRYDFAEMDEIAGLLNSHNVRPYWSYCYVPAPVQSHPPDWRSPPLSPALWGEVMKACGEHFARGRAGFHEIYNEPDNRDFFAGTRDDYLAMYREGSRAIRSADPDALIGGPAVAFTESWIDPFLDAVVRDRLPLDFLSFHYYPRVPWPEGDVHGVIRSVSAHLDRHPELRTVEMHLNEYNSYPIHYPRGGSQDKSGLAAELLHDFKAFLAEPALTEVSWAQFMDSGQGNYSGMISLDGHRKAVFNAYRLYAMMPVDRSRLRVEGAEGVEGIASGDEQRAGLLLWNRSSAEQTAHIDLRHLPFAPGRVRVYRIDAHHASWGDDPTKENLEPAEPDRALAARTTDWEGSIPVGAVVGIYIDSTDAALPRKLGEIGRLVRVLHDYPSRSSPAYADVDRNTWTFRLGSGGDAGAQVKAGVYVKGLPNEIEIKGEELGPLELTGSRSLLGVRVDYAEKGAFTRSVLFPGFLAKTTAKREWVAALVPWGTGRGPDRVSDPCDLRHFVLPLRANAPPDWKGDAQVTVLLTQAGTHARVKLRIGPVVPPDR